MQKTKRPLKGGGVTNTSIFVAPRMLQESSTKK